MIYKLHELFSLYFIVVIHTMILVFVVTKEVYKTFMMSKKHVGSAT